MARMLSGRGDGVARGWTRRQELRDVGLHRQAQGFLGSMACNKKLEYYDPTHQSDLPLPSRREIVCEYMNFVVDDTDEVLSKKETRRAVGRILLKGLIHVKKKLVTKEDPLYLHEIFGISALVYFYRYYVCYTSQGTLGLGWDSLGWFTMALHFALSSSSLLFSRGGQAHERVL